MVQSRFNVVKTEGEVTWVYNTLTSAFVKLDALTWTAVQAGDEPEVEAALRREGILVDNTEDEWLTYKFQYYAHAFRRRGLYLSIAPTMQCNFACPYCFEGENKHFPAMNDKVEAALVKYLEVNGRNGLSINWFGGEPLLAWKRILSICRQLDERGVEFRSSMVTNGSLLTPDKLPELGALHLTFVQISMDGLAATHDRRRCFKNGAPSFSLIMRNIGSFLCETDVPLVVQVAVDHTNPTAFDDLLAEFTRLYPDEMRTNRLQVGCNHVQDRTAFDKAGVCFTPQDLFGEQVISLRSGENNARTPRLPGIALPCMFRSTGHFAIDSAGYLYRCLEHLGDPRHSVGNLVEGKLSRAAMARTTFAEDPFDDPQCRQCNVLPICGGGCPLDRLAARRGGGCPCSFYKEYLPDLLPELYRRHYQHRKKKLTL